MPFLNLTGARLHYETVGEGERALLFIPAGICDTRMWQPQMEFFSPEYRCITFDPRGYGQTEMLNGEPYSNRADVAALLDHLGVGRAAAVGCSRGGQIALDFTLEYPSRAAAVVPVCGGLGGMDFDPPAEENAVFAEMDHLDAEGRIDELIEREIDVFVVGFGRTREQVDPFLIERVRVMQQTNAQHAAAGEQHQPMVLMPPAATRLADIRVPALIVLGMEDDAFAHAAAQKMATDIPGAQMITLENTAHLPSMERPDVFNAALGAFLRDVQWG